MNWKWKRLLFFALWLVVPLVLWFGITAIFGEKWVTQASIVYVGYLFLLTLGANLSYGRSIWYSVLVLVLSLFWVATSFLLVPSTDSSSLDGLLAGTSVVFNQVLAIVTSVVLVGVSLLGYLLSHLIHSIRHLRDSDE
ncbi:hypothetical protein [Streptococcus sp. DD13]|uniref:hypothetical protein n=1 Tax=Streptococcus sp. DD13 TaxID=1777881 RepID=UPI00079B3124|nr:hypothetical protein [Streptococcus sp. DD13]KXT79323.1 hypothetical protein STRDD13_00021 [Streptococcus sp. DD13]